MRYVVVSVVKGEAGNFNNNLRKKHFGAFFLDEQLGTVPKSSFLMNLLEPSPIVQSFAIYFLFCLSFLL